MTSLKDRLAADARLKEVPSQLWESLRADPVRAPEHLALAAHDFHGPAAAKWIEEKRRFYAYSGGELAVMAKKKHAALARFSGGAMGFGGFVTIVPDLVALAWIQSRMVFFIAAAYGFDPHDDARPAELLVIQGLYPDVATARQALDGAGRSVASAMVQARMNSEETLLKRLSMMVGKRIGKRVVGRFIPGAAIAFNAIGNERDTRALADQAIRYYGGGSVVPGPQSALPPGGAA